MDVEFYFRERDFDDEFLKKKKWRAIKALESMNILKRLMHC